MSAFKLIKNIYTTKKPVSIVHFLTNRCNARCSFCFIDFDDPQTFSDELTLDEINLITKKLPNSIVNVNLTGGEPFLSKDITEIAVCYFENSSIESIFITSNGSFPDRMNNFCKTIIEKFPDKKIYISLSLDDIKEKHNNIRKLKNLFDKCVSVYHELKNISTQIQTNIAITVSHENCDSVINLYNHLKIQCGIDAMTAILAREEGVYKYDPEKKTAILDSYKKLSNLIKDDLKNKNNTGYQNSLQSKVMNEKNKLVYDQIYETSKSNRFISKCYAGSLFGVIKSNGDVSPCEMLDVTFGNLRNYDYDYQIILDTEYNKQFCKNIIKDECFCTYECAWTFNILGNIKYHPSILKGLIS